MQPIKEILEWAQEEFDAAGRRGLEEWCEGYEKAKWRVRQYLAEYQQDPAWVCLEGMTAGELQAYDYGEALAMAAVKDILDGKDNGQRVCQEPWQSIRQRLVEVVRRAGDATP